MNPSPLLKERGGALLDWLRTATEADVESALGLEEPSIGERLPPGENLVGYHASGVQAIAQAIELTPIRASDLVIDLGAGLGKVLLLIHLVTGARCRGIELQPELVRRARGVTHRLGIAESAVRFDEGDARSADLEEGTVFYLYSPFEGPVLQAVLKRLEPVAKTKPMTVCALGIDLERSAPWLVRRAPSDASDASENSAKGGSRNWHSTSFWLALYDSAFHGAPLA